MTRYARACAAQENDACTALTRLAREAGGCAFERGATIETYRTRCSAAATDGACAVVTACTGGAADAGR